MLCTIRTHKVCRRYEAAGGAGCARNCVWTEGRRIVALIVCLLLHVFEWIIPRAPVEKASKHKKRVKKQKKKNKSNFYMHEKKE